MHFIKLKPIFWQGIDGGSIEFLVNALNELIISEDIAKKLKDGIRMPILLDFEQTAAEVSLITIKQKQSFVYTF